ncbi:Uncharacterized protein GBIM_06326 [Gryllus bimaculatus]|nr:Uncharacterized protein GBIM_06326 [Gryllus bimaculatus]
MMGFSYEKRALKRPRLGPPDVYPQEAKQKEDELTTVNVKHGFTLPQLSDEFGSAKNCNVTPAKVGQYFNGILNKKEELNTLPDTGRKRQQINTKDNFWPATARSKNAIEAWFKDLAGSKPLIVLAKRAPNFNKKEEIFMMLCEYQVPMLRAAWFIKLSYAYTVAVSEVKIKKRQLPDPSQEWTQTLNKFLKDQLGKLQDYYHHSNSGGGSSTAGSTPGGSSHGGAVPSPASQTGQGNSSLNSSLPAMTEEQKLAQKQWTYCIQLAKYLYEEGLLERQEFLQWVLEQLDRMRSAPADDGILRLLLPLALQYLDEFVQSELLARKLAYLCARKLAQLCQVAQEGAAAAAAAGAVGSGAVPSPSCMLPAASPQSPLLPGTASVSFNFKECLAHASLFKVPKEWMSVHPYHSVLTAAQNQVALNPLAVTFNEYLTCPHHRDIVLALSAVLQVITMECPTALVWNCVGEGKSSSVLNGSPLDHLPCAPSTLPMPQRANNPQIRKQLRIAEEHIRQRSRAAEGRWSCDKWQQSSAGATTAKVLTALDALDRHSFERMDASNSLDTLYAKIFAPPGTKDTNSTTGGSSGGNGGGNGSSGGGGSTPNPATPAGPSTPGEAHSGTG